MGDLVERLQRLGKDSVGNYGMPIAAEAANEIESLRSALAKSASREAALNNSDTGVCAFKEWYDAIWLGDQEHGQTLPKSGPEYDRYMDGYTLAYGAWNAALAKIKEAV